MVKSEDDTGLGILDLCCLMGFAVVAVKRLGNSRIPRNCFGSFTPSQ